MSTVPELPKFYRLNLTDCLRCDKGKEQEMIQSIVNRGSEPFIGSSTTWITPYEARTWIGDKLGKSAVVRTCLFQSADERMLVEFTRMSGDRGLDYDFAFAATNNSAFSKRHSAKPVKLSSVVPFEPDEFFEDCDWRFDSSVKDTMQWLIKLSKIPTIRQHLRKIGAGEIALNYASQARSHQPGGWAATVAANAICDEQILTI